MQDFKYKINSVGSSHDKRELHKNLVPSEHEEFSKVIDALVYFGEYFYNKGVYGEALDYLKIALKMLRKSKDKIKDGYNHLRCLFWIGKCNMGVNKLCTVIVNFELSELKSGNIEHHKVEVEMLTARCLFFKGKAEQKTNKHEKAFILFQSQLSCGKIFTMSLKMLNIL